MTMMTRLRTGLAAGLLSLGALAQQAAAIDIQEVSSPGGTTFWLVEEPSIPIVSVEISFDGGARLDPEGLPGLATMTAALMDEGAGEMDAIAFAEARDAISARFGFGADRDSFTVSLQTLADQAPASARLLATALTAPRFDPDPIARTRSRMLSSIAEGKTSPSTVAALTWYARAFPDHPYGRPTDGTEEGVSAIKRDDLVAAHGRLLTRANAIVAIVGAIGPDEAASLVDTLLGGLPEGVANPAPAVPAPPPAGVEVVELAVPQSAAIWGQAGLTREDPDFIPAFVMNYILGGGGFSSRLTEEVREKRGLAYGVYSYLSVLDGAQLYMGGVQTANARMGESLEVIRAEWARMKGGGVTEEELAKARQYLTGAFALRFDSNAKIAAYLVFIQREDLGIDYFDRRNGLIEAVTLDDVARVADRLLDPDGLSFVVVGQPAGL